MSHLLHFMELIVKYCKDDPHIEDQLKKLDLIDKENSSLQIQYKELELENTRLQMELYNIETMMAPLKKLPADGSVENANMQLMETGTNIRNAIAQIDFYKIVQCKHHELEQRYRKEWQQFEDYTVSLLQWHEKMEQRHVVQRYRKVEKHYKETLEHFQMLTSESEKSAKQSLLLLREAKQKLNGLILDVVKGTQTLNKLREMNEHADIVIDLTKQRSELLKELESKQNKTLSSMISYNSSCPPSVNTGSLQTVQYEMPKFPSFNDILKTFNQDLNRSEPLPQITMIENTTNIMVKSILRNSSSDLMEINQSITTKQKHVQFNLQLEDMFEFKETTECTLSDISSDDTADTRVEVSRVSSTKDKTMEEQTESINLLTPSDKEINSSNNKQEPTNLTAKPKIDILECIVIKPPKLAANKFSSYDECAASEKENHPPQPNAQNLQENNIKVKTNKEEFMPPPQAPAPSQVKRAAQKQSLYEEFLNTTLSIESSSDDDAHFRSSKTGELKDFETFFNEQNGTHDNVKTEGKDVAASDGAKNNGGKANEAPVEFHYGRQDFFFDVTDASDGVDPFARGNIMDFFS